MKILTISDSFKGTRTSKQIGSIITNKLVEKGHLASYIPISDGGEGFLDVIYEITKIKKLKLSVYDPLFRLTNAYYIFDEKTKTGYIEMAEASGITKLKKEELRTINTSTYGLGMLIKHLIINHKAKKIVMGIGGSATSDMGVGMLEALGVEFLDRDNLVLKKMNNLNIAKIRKYNLKSFSKLIKGIEFITLSDVTNPLLGENGSIAIFAPQKGASSIDLLIMEKNFKHFYKKLNIDYKYQATDFPGAGAAGGVGYCMKYFFNSKIYSGVDELLKMIDFATIKDQYDLIITGEGKYDSQSSCGKVISGIKKYQPKNLAVVCGISTINEENVYSIVPKYATLDQSLENPDEPLKNLIDDLIKEKALEN